MDIYIYIYIYIYNWPVILLFKMFSFLWYVYPNAGHCACIIHLKRNIRTIFKQRQLGYLVSKAAKAFRMVMFYETFAEISSINQACADYLIDIVLEHWTRSHFPGRRYNIMTSNLVESWNSVLSHF